MTVIHSDCLDAMRAMPDASVDSIVSDPPYGLAFMGKAWDHGVPGEPFWAEALRVAKPGAYLVAFGGTRTYHRLACAIEDAGWEVRDCLAWIFGQGFPKSHNLDGERKGWGTALKPAYEPIILARKPLVGTVAANVAAHGTGALNVDGCRIGTTVETWPKTRQRPADGVNGYTRKMRGDDVGVTVSAGNAPSGRWPANVCLDEDAAAMLDAQSGISKGSGPREGVRGGHKFGGEKGENDTLVGRWHGDSGGASRFFYCAKAPARERWGILTCDCQATRLPAWESEDQNHDAQTDATSPERGTCAGSSEVECASITPSSGRPHTGRSLPDGKSITSTATSKTTASTTCDSSPRPNTSASTPDASCGMASGGSHAGSVASESPSTPTTGTSAAKGGRSTGVVGPVTSLRLSATSVCESCGGKLRVESHPTQKPIALMRWLVRLVTPPNGLVLDPFTGSGTTGCAAVLEGFRFLGCEREAEYVAIAEKRIAHWAAQKAPEPEPSLF